MSRKIYLLMFLLIFVASDTAHGRRCRWRHARRTCCPEKVCPVPEPDEAHYCLQDIYMNFPSGPDMYFCLTHPFGCPPDVNSFEDLYYGDRHYSLAQSCDLCETEGYAARKARRPPCHGKVFTTKQQACN